MIRAPLPAFSRAANQRLVEDMDVGNCLLSMPSLTQLPDGEEKFKIILAEPFGFCLHIMPLILASAGRLAAGNGPAAKPFSTHSATASVTSGPNSKALGALVLTLGLRAWPRQPMSAPPVRSLQTTSNRGCLPQSSLAASALSLTGQTRDVAVWMGLDGNALQNSVDAGFR
jgi:hypothetical protein